MRLVSTLVFLYAACAIAQTLSLERTELGSGSWIETQFSVDPPSRLDVTSSNGAVMNATYPIVCGDRDQPSPQLRFFALDHKCWDHPSSWGTP